VIREALIARCANVIETHQVVAGNMLPQRLKLAHKCRGNTVPVTSEFQARPDDVGEKAGEAPHEPACDCA